MTQTIDATKRRQIRAQVRQQRRNLDAVSREIYSRNVATRLVNSQLITHSQRIACFISNDGEVDTAPIIERLWTMGKTCYLPVLHPLKYHKLWFMPFNPDSKMTYNRYGIIEPVIHQRQCIAPWCLDLVLTPLVAFDKSGNRLGMGGGYYDRTFAFMNKKTNRSKPQLIGLAFEFQKVADIPQCSWDVPLAAVVTEQYNYQRTL